MIYTSVLKNDNGFSLSPGQETDEVSARTILHALGLTFGLRQLRHPGCGEG